MNWRRFAWVLGGVAALAAIGWAVLRRDPLPVEVATVRTGSIRSYVEERGKTRLPDVVQITLPLEGRILPIELREGDPVHAGQIVARMDMADLDTDLTEARHTVERHDRSLEQVELAIQQADQTVIASRSKYDFAESEFGRLQALFARGATSESSRNQAEMTMIESRVDLRKNELTRSMYAIGRRVLELMRSTDVAKLAKLERDRRRMEIVSPVSGVVLSREVSNEQVMRAGSVLMEIGDLERIEIEADVLTQDALTIALGDPVDIETVGLGAKPVRGKVTRIFPRGFTKISSLGVEQQRVRVVIGLAEGEFQRLTEEGRQLGVDYHVRVRIYTDQRDSATITPRGALFRGAEGDWRTFVIRGGRARLVRVELGIRNDYDAEILEGLESGEQVVLAPDSSLTDGAFVVPSS